MTQAMTEAMRLIRSGQLGAATDMLRGQFAGSSATPPTVHDLKPQPRTGRTVEPDTSGGRFETHMHRSAAGQLGYKLHVPAGVKAGAPLLVMLHGCTQSPDDFAAGTRMNAAADAHGMIVAWPGQTTAANPQKCWNWFRPGDQRAGAGEPALIAGLTRELAAQHNVDPARIFVAGLSAGGAAAAIMAAGYPDLYAAVGVHSGLACGSAHDLPSALGAMRSGGGRKRRPGGARAVPVITFHGDQDATVAEVNAREIVAAASAAAPAPLAVTSESGRSSGGRSWQRTVHHDTAGRALIEQWTVAGLGHAWSGGSTAGSYTDPSGPDATGAMLRFFLER